MMAWLRRIWKWKRVGVVEKRPKPTLDTGGWRKVRAQGERAAKP